MCMTVEQPTPATACNVADQCTANEQYQHRRQWQDAAHGHEGAAALLAENAAEEAAAAAALKLRRVSPTDDFQSEGSSERFPGSASPRTDPSPQSTSARDRSPGTDVKLYHRAVVVAQDPGSACVPVAHETR